MGFWEKKLQNLEMAGDSGQPHLLSSWNEKQRFFVEDQDLFEVFLGGLPFFLFFSPAK